MLADFPATKTILAVDDEPAVLTALQRLLRPEGIQVLTARSGDEALALLERTDTQVSVVVSDFSMPGMDGAEFLSVVRGRWPDCTRVLLTGKADLPAAARAVNEGQLSRLCTKPWNAQEFRQLVNQAIGQHQMLVENRRLRALADQQAADLDQWNQHLEALVLERTQELERANSSLQHALLDTVRLLLTFMEHRLPEQATHARETARLVGRLAERAGIRAEDARRMQVAAMVHDIGLLTLPEGLARSAPEHLPPAGLVQYQRHPGLGQQLLARVDQLTELGAWIRHHHERWDGAGYPDRLAGDAIPLPSRLISLASGYLHAAPRLPMVWVRRQRQAGAYDPALLILLEQELQGEPAQPDEAGLDVAELQPGMLLVDDIRSVSGATIMRAGRLLSPEHIEAIQRFANMGALSTQRVMVKVSK